MWHRNSPYHHNTHHFNMSPNITSYSCYIYPQSQSLQSHWQGGSYSTIHSLLISIPCIRLVSLKFNLWLLLLLLFTHSKPIALIIRLAMWYARGSLHDRRSTTKQVKRIRLNSNPKGMRLFNKMWMAQKLNKDKCRQQG